MLQIQELHICQQNTYDNLELKSLYITKYHQNYLLKTKMKKNVMHEYS